MGSRAWGGFDPSNIDYEDGPVHINFSNITQRRGPKQRPNPIVDVDLTFKESIEGTSKEISYKRYNKCNSCGGDGGKPGSNVCSKCNGHGHFTQRQGNVVMRASCPSCSGSGKDFEECNDCHGFGTVLQTITTKVELPFGLRDGQIIQAGGGGNYIGQQHSGFFSGHRTDAFSNAILRIHVQQDPDMKLDESGQHVVSDINLTLLEALKGKNVKVRTLKGDLTLKVKPGAKNGQTIVAKGYGTGGMGNHIFNVNVGYPESTEKLIEFLENQE
jgi:molecular chaperone DnaJ